MKLHVLLFFLFTGLNPFSTTAVQMSVAESRLPASAMGAVVPMDCSSQTYVDLKDQEEKYRKKIRTLDAMNMVQEEQVDATTNDSRASLIQNDLLHRQHQLRQQMQTHRQIRSCLFQKEIQRELVNTFSDEKNKEFMKSLEGISTCLLSKPNKLGFLSGLKDFFANLAQHFGGKPQLSNEDCKVLEKTYELWASLHESLNVNSISGDLSGSIPLYNVNGHQDAYQYWEAERVKGNIPPQGLTLLHADTHTDMGHIHDHSPDSWTNHTVSVADMGALLAQSNEEEFRRRLANSIMSAREGLVSKSQKGRLLEQLDRQPMRRIKGQLRAQLKRRVRDISQPLTAAAASKLTNKMLLCLPPWSNRLPRNSIVKGVSQAYDINVIKKSKFSISNSSGDDQSIFFGTRIGKNMLLENHSSNSPIEVYTENDVESGDVNEISDLLLHVTECNREVQVVRSQGVLIDDLETQNSSQQSLPGFENYFDEEEKENGFLLDIDLDVFVSEGYSGIPILNETMPESWARKGREHKEVFGVHVGHLFSNETDENIEVPVKEMRLIKSRMESFFDRLKTAKEKGYLPRVITISDSTILNRALSGDVASDDKSGGNYTPACLVFLINYSVRKKLKELYNTELLNEMIN